MFEHSPLLQGVFANAKKYPDKNALIVGDSHITYTQLVVNIRRTATLLANLGISKGDRIILSAQKDVEFIYVYFASHIIGATNVIVDSESNKERLLYIETNVSPLYCFGYHSDSVKSIQYNELDIHNACPFDDNTSFDLLSKNDIAEILFTTGTTGAPKGVCLSYWNIFSSANNINGFIENDETDVELLGLPICHSFGLGRIRCNLLKGSTLVILGSFANVRLFLKTIEKYNVTGFGVVPAAWAYIRKISGTRIGKYSSQIRYIEIGSAAMPKETKVEMLKMFPNSRICMHYGLTEASRNCFLEFHDTDHLDSIGKPVSDQVDIKIFDSNGKEVSNGQKGEICVAGNMVLSRYLIDSDNKDAFYGNYFRTGDSGYISEDEYIYLLGREKELINVGGKKVSPMEVEDMICSLGVGDCVCVPMKDENGIMGELVKCYILKDSTTLSFEQIAEALKDKLEPYKQPVLYEWIDSIPQTSSGKKQRINLQ